MVHFLKFSWSYEIDTKAERTYIHWWEVVERDTVFSFAEIFISNLAENSGLVKIICKIFVFEEN